MLAILMILLSLGFAFFAMRLVGGGSFSQDDSIWKQAKEKAKKKHPAQKSNSKE